MVMEMARKLALKTTMDKAKERYKKGDTIEEIAEKFWASPGVSNGLNALGVSPEELIKLITDAVKEKKPWWKRILGK